MQERCNSVLGKIQGEKEVTTILEQKDFDILRGIFHDEVRSAVKEEIQTAMTGVRTDLRTDMDARFEKSENLLRNEMDARFEKTVDLLRSEMDVRFD